MSRLHPLGLRTLERLSRQSYNELFSLWLGIVFVFGVLYFLLTVFAPQHGISIDADWHIVYKLLDSMYFSAITATTTGYGDLIPWGFSKALSALEVVLAFGTFTIFMSKLVAQNEVREKKEAQKRRKK
jgi:voltage-gated potassium channel Kch